MLVNCSLLMYLLQRFSPCPKFWNLPKAEVSILMNSNMNNLIHGTCLWYLKSHWHTQGHMVFSCVVFLGVLLLCFFIEVCSPFWVNISEGSNIKCVSSFFFACRCPDVLVPFIEETIFASLCYLCFFIKDKFIIFIWVYFWAVYSIDLFVYSFSNTTWSWLL